MVLAEVAVVIPAAGKGKRMGAPFNKQYLKLEGRPLLAYTLDIFLGLDPGQVVVVVGPDEENLFREEVLRNLPGKHQSVNVALGGQKRQDSVYNGLLMLSPDIRYVCVHDGARPFVTPRIIRSVLDSCRERGAAAAAVPLKDTIKEIDSLGFGVRTHPREKLVSVQTPQIFQRSLLLGAFARARSEGFLATDETTLVERYGGKVHMVSGSYENIKITTPEDLFIAEAILKQREVEGCG